MTVFPEFFFESNQWFSPIKSLTDLTRIVEETEYTLEFVLAAKESVHGRTESTPCFGWRSEHQGQRTLAEYLFEHGIEVPSGVSV